MHTYHAHEDISFDESLQVQFKTYTISPSTVPAHWHSHIEVIYVLSGSMEVTVSNTHEKIETGQFMIINSGDIHSTRCLETSSIQHMLIPLSLLSRCIPSFEQIRFTGQNRQKKKCDYFVSYEDKFPHEKDYLNRMGMVYHGKKDGYCFLFISLLYQFLYDIYRMNHMKISASAFAKREQNKSRLEQIQDYVEVNYAKAITLDEISGFLELNPEYFCRFFKRNMGITFFEYVNSIRLNSFYKDLVETNQTVTELMQIHGFTNYRHFSKSFKEMYGCTPLQARKKEILKTPL